MGLRETVGTAWPRRVQAVLLAVACAAVVVPLFTPRATGGTAAMVIALTTAVVAALSGWLCLGASRGRRSADQRDGRAWWILAGGCLALAAGTLVAGLLENGSAAGPATNGLVWSEGPVWSDGPAWSGGPAWSAGMADTGDLRVFPPASAGVALLMVFYPLVVAGVWLLLSSDRPRWSPVMWWDGCMVAIGSVAVGAAVLEFVTDRAPDDAAGLGHAGFVVVDIGALAVVLGLIAVNRSVVPAGVWWVTAALALLTVADLQAVLAPGGHTGGLSWDRAAEKGAATQLALALPGVTVAVAAALLGLAPPHRRRDGPRHDLARDWVSRATGGRRSERLRAAALPGMAVGGAAVVVLAALLDPRLSRWPAVTALVALGLALLRLAGTLLNAEGLDATPPGTTDDVTGLANRRAVSDALRVEGADAAARSDHRTSRRTSHRGDSRDGHRHSRRNGQLDGKGNRQGTEQLTGQGNGQGNGHGNGQAAAGRHAAAPGDGVAERTIALLLVDLDRFKEVNDALGHPAGDRLLAAVGDRFSGALHDGQLLARLGGDEFAVVIPDAGVAAVRRVATALHTALEPPFQLDGSRLHVRASIGAAVARLPRDDPSDLLRRADVAMYQAKADGGGGLRFYAPETDTGSQDRLRRMDELRQALTRGDIVVHVQPQVSLRRGQIVGVEALARWRHPQDGVLLPQAFLPLAAATGLVRPVARSIVDAALAACAEWWHAGHVIPVAVNLTAEDLAAVGEPDAAEEAADGEHLDLDDAGADEDIWRSIRQTLARYRLPGEALHIEITEESLLRDAARTARLLQKARAQGVKIALDDYGTGYSSLAYLQQLPLDVLKLDQVFARTIAQRTTSTIVRHTVAMAHGLGLRVVAEGIEDEPAARALTDLGCDVGQGRFFHDALTPEDFVQLLRR